MKTLFIVYPGGCGGNHITNMISTNPIFTQLFPSDDYITELTSYYKELEKSYIIKPGESYLGNSAVHGIKVHFSKHSNLNQLKDEEEFKKLLSNEKINLLGGHEHDFYEAEMDSKKISKFDDAFWLVLSYPKENTIPYNRIKLYEFTPRPDRYTYPFYIFDKEFPGIHPKADHTNSFLLETEKIFTEKGSEYLREKLKEVDIELPEIADTLHKIWFEKITKVLETYNMLPN